MIGPAKINLGSLFFCIRHYFYIFPSRKFITVIKSNGFENNFKADNANYFETSNVIVELYTEEKDIDLENRLKEILKEYEYEASYDYISEERMYMASFSFII